MDTDDELRLEHYLRIQTRLTNMVRTHIEEKLSKPDEFIYLIFECEQVHIVTRIENYAALKAKGDYSLAGIKLIKWEEIEHARRSLLWRKMLRGKVANIKEYEPHIAES